MHNVGHTMDTGNSEMAGKEFTNGPQAPASKYRPTVVFALEAF